VVVPEEETMNWISALHLENVLAEQAEQRRRLGASWGPLWTRRPRRTEADVPTAARPGSVVRLPAARRPERDAARQASHPAA
jgi:hypothetical protein